MNFLAIADSIEEYVSEQGWTLPDVMDSIKETCPHVFDQVLLVT